MTEISETARLKLDPGAAWSLIGDFGAVGDWHPMLIKADSEGNARGCIRRAEAKDGSRQVERLELYDSANRLYRYSMQETPLPVSNYTAEFRIDPAGQRESTVRWSARFGIASGNPRQGEEMIRQFLKAGTESLTQRCG